MQSLATIDSFVGQSKRASELRKKNLRRSVDPQPSEIAARLDRLADVRANVVARGKALVANPNYPDKKTIRAVADLLARKMRS